VGDIYGVTENYYGIALIMIITTLIDQTKFWKRKVANVKIWVFVLLRYEYLYSTTGSNHLSED